MKRERCELSFCVTKSAASQAARELERVGVTTAHHLLCTDHILDFRSSHQGKRYFNMRRTAASRMHSLVDWIKYKEDCVRIASDIARELALTKPVVIKTPNQMTEAEKVAEIQKLRSYIGAEFTSALEAAKRGASTVSPLIAEASQLKPPLDDSDKKRGKR